MGPVFFHALGPGRDLDESWGRWRFQEHTTPSRPAEYLDHVRSLINTRQCCDDPNGKIIAQLGENVCSQNRVLGVDS